MDALIGHTGFVGGHLKQQHGFASCFNTQNIGDIGGAAFGTVVCAAAPGSMIGANRNPQRDQEQVAALCDNLATIRAERFVLVSSIAVYRAFDGGDTEELTDFQQELAYGKHRRALEVFCQKQFDNCLVMRLPALFGAGLKKNFLFDLMNPVPAMLTHERLAKLRDALPPALGAVVAGFYRADEGIGMLVLDREVLNASPARAEIDVAVTAVGMASLGFHHTQTTYQYYDMTRLWTDIGIALDNGLEAMNLATEPLAAGSIHRALTGRPMPESGARLHREDMRTRHADYWGRRGPYLEEAEEILTKLIAFFSKQRFAA